jgi:hypothetical protein
MTHPLISAAPSGDHATSMTSSWCPFSAPTARHAGPSAPPSASASPAGGGGGGGGASPNARGGGAAPGGAGRQTRTSPWSPAEARQLPAAAAAVAVVAAAAMPSSVSGQVGAQA